MRRSKNPRSADYTVYQTEYIRKFKDDYDQQGYDALGFDRDGNFADGGRYDYKGLDVDRNDKNGFGLKIVNGVQMYIHKDTKTEYDNEGYDRNGYDSRGFKKGDIVNKSGFNREGIFVKNNSLFDDEGYDINGYDEYGFSRYGIHKVTKKAFDEYDFYRTGINRITKNRYDINLFDIKGIHKYTGKPYDLAGYDRDCKDINGNEENIEIVKDKNEKELLKIIDILVKQELSVEKFKLKYKITITELKNFAFRKGINRRVYEKLKQLERDYLRLENVSDIEDLCNSTILRIQDEEIKMSDRYDEVLKIKQYIIDNEIYPCDYTIKKYFKYYLEGAIDLNKPVDSSIEEMSKVDERRAIAKKMYNKAMSLKNINK